MNKTNNIKKIISVYFSKLSFVTAVYLHGSIIKGNYRVDSDIDIGIIINNNSSINKLSLLEYASDLEIKLSNVVDIGIISSENLVYAKEVITNGICIHCKNEYQRKLKEATLLSMYVDFQSERMEVLNAYRN